MANLKTTYMGLELKNPFIAGASGYTANLDRIKQLEEAGAAAVVCASLFEEQIQYERFRLEEDLHQFDNLYAEMTDFFPRVKHAGPKEHLGWVKKAKESVGIPVIASLNAVNRNVWSEWAVQLEDTGADALECNFYATPSSFALSSQDVEAEQIEILTEVKNKVKIPVSVKLSAFYTNPLHFIKRLDDVGVRGFVLFNRLFQPDIDVEKQSNRYWYHYFEGIKGCGKHGCGNFPAYYRCLCHSKTLPERRAAVCDKKYKPQPLYEYLSFSWEIRIQYIYFDMPSLKMGIGCCEDNVCSKGKLGSLMCPRSGVVECITAHHFKCHAVTSGLPGGLMYEISGSANNLFVCVEY